MANSTVDTAHVPAPLDVVHPLSISHVVFRTTDVDRLIAWYCTVLGAQIVLRHDMVSFITWDDAQDRIAFLEVPAADDVSGAPLRIDHVAFEMPSISDVVATYRRLGALGIEPYLCVNHGVASSMYYRDPDGNQVELT